MKKTIITLLLSLALTLTMIPTASFAAGGGADKYETDEIRGGGQAVRLAAEGEDQDQEEDPEEKDDFFSKWQGHELAGPGEEKILTTFTYDGTSAVYIEAYCYYGEELDKADTYAGERDLTLTVLDDTTGEPLEASEPFGLNHSQWYYYGPDQELPEPILPNLTDGHQYSLVLRSSEESKFEYGIDFWCRKCPAGFAGKVKTTKTVSRHAGDNNYLYVNAADTTTPDDSLSIVTEAVSSNESVLEAKAFGSRALVFPKKPGKSAKVTITTLNGQKFTVTVNVTNGVPVLTGCTDGYFEVNRGVKTDLGIKYNNKSVKWSTSNKKVAKVSKKGVVTAVDPGQCMIKAKCGGYTCRCVVEVYRLDPSVEAEIAGFDNLKKTIDINVTNHGTKKLTVYSANAGYHDGSGEESERSMKFKKGTYVTVAAGAARTIKYKIVKGTFDWDPLQTEGAAVKFRYKYDGMKYDGSTN
ncbi:MAG: Ig-like domain-containing protein [Bacillota bacterium]|nr:Ig-like domain-containing protein [Bacillota bacterium]